MQLALKTVLVLAVLLQVNLTFAGRIARDTIGRASEVALAVTALRTLLTTTASDEQLAALKRDAPLCADKSASAFLGIFEGSLGQFLGSMLGRRRREAVNVQPPSLVPIQVNAEVA